MRPFRSSSARLAALYTGAFAAAVVGLGAITLLTTRAALKQQFDARINAEALALAQEERTEGLEGVLNAVKERDRTPGALDYGLDAPDGRPIAGRLAGRHAPLGWSNLRLQQPGGEVESVRVLTSELPGGNRLVVGDDDARSEALQATVLEGFGWAFVGVVLLGIFGAFGLSRGVQRRLASMSDAAEAIIGGDLARRIPIGGSDDELDRLATTFNRMLDRMGALMESLRQVSNDIAHDLRTPLTRLRQRLEAARDLERPSERAEAIEGALRDLDGALETFAALLRIAQVEGGARRAGFRPLDLAGLAAEVVEAFAPSAEDAGQRLSVQASGTAFIDGDRELLTQMIVNLVENALRHAGPAAVVNVAVRTTASEVVLAVADNGPGVPAAERQRIFDRFYRLERSRSTPGSGLGLALVGAIARLHQATIALGDADPGLTVTIAFAQRPAPETGPEPAPGPTLGFLNPSDTLVPHQPG